jgi:hypothetical protein
MAELTIWTYQDLVEHVLDVVDARKTGRNVRNARRAVLNAYNDLTLEHSWNYFANRRFTFDTVASQTTGTITYTQSTRTVLLTGATWPSDVEFYHLIIGDTHYDIESATDTTNIVLTVNSNPGADVAAGSSYTVYRGTYPLPVNFRKFGRLFDLVGNYPIGFTHPDELHAQRVYYYDSPGNPWYATIVNVGEYLGGFSLQFGPPPSTKRTYEFLYQAAPRELGIYKHSSDLVTATSGSASVTFDAGVLPHNCVGSIIRFSPNGTDLPTSVVGDIDDVDNPFRQQRVIISRDGDVTATLDENSSLTLTTVKYVISDPLDIVPSQMMTPLQRLAEAEFATLQTMKNREAKWVEARHALLLALERDQLTTRSTPKPNYYDPYRKPTIVGGAAAD